MTESDSVFTIYRYTSRIKKGREHMKPCKQYKHRLFLIWILTAALFLHGCSFLEDTSRLGAVSVLSSPDFSLEDIPSYSGQAYVEIHRNVPYFEEEDLTEESYESYGRLDKLGRCTGAIACVGQDLMPTEKRGRIGSVKPTGWHLVKYAGIDGNYLYNRCHLIGYQLSGENANEQNLITGTRYLNVTGMLPFENEIADYVKDTGNHVLYRVTPIFSGDNLLADGVLMEAISVEDHGSGVCFNVFCYNVQPGVEIDYATGASEGPEFTGSDTSGSEQTSAEEADYIINTNTGKFHLPSCGSVEKMHESNKLEYTGTREDLILQGYSACGSCHP